MDHGHPPRGGFAGLVPELLVEDVAASVEFWCGALGFGIAYRRPEQGFAYLQRAEGAQVMLCARAGIWETGRLERPFGRGVLFQVLVESLEQESLRLGLRGVPIHTGPREVWRRHGDRRGGRREIVVQDPDGYLVMLAQDLGERPLDRPQ